MSEAPKPNRSELIALKRRIMLANQGHSLLKKKRDGLMREFFILLKKTRLDEEKLLELYRLSQKAMDRARVVESDLKIKSIGWAIREHPELELETRSIIGVKVPLIKGTRASRPLAERGYEVFNSVTIDESATAYMKLVDAIIATSETQVAIRRLLLEIEKTKRRVNALEYSLIPKLETQKRVITARLEEIERENFMRLKTIKTRLAMQEG